MVSILPGGLVTVLRGGCITQWPHCAVAVLNGGHIAQWLYCTVALRANCSDTSSRCAKTSAHVHNDRYRYCVHTRAESTLPRAAEASCIGCAILMVFADP